MIRPARLLLIAALTLLACSSSKDEAKVDADKLDAAASIRRPPDIGAMLTQEPSGTSPAIAQEDPVQASAGLVYAGHHYVAVPLSAAIPEWTVRALRVEISGAAAYGLTAPSVSYAASAEVSQRQTPHFALVRFVGQAPASFSLTLTSLPATPDEPARITTLPVTLPDKTPTDKTLPGAFYTALGEHMSTRGSQPFYTFAAWRLPLVGAAGGLQRALQPAQLAQRARRSDLSGAMALYTGMSAVEESLQHDRGLLLREPDAQPTIALNTIEGVKLVAHPWDKLIAQLPSKPVIEPMASVVPADFAYMHFHDLRELSRLSGELDSWLTPLVRVMERRAEDSEIVARYEDQLALRKTKLSEQLGHVATQGVALVTSDPFLREGSDLTVIFHVRNKAVLDGALDKLLAERLAERPDSKTVTYQLGQRAVTHTSTPDGLIERHKLELGEHVLVSNSRRALERIIDAADKKSPALADSGDFKYMRARYPFDVKQEAGFLFIGDAFVANAIGPRAKILAARRMAGAADVRAVNNAALLFGWLEGRQPKEIAEVIREGLLDPSELESGGAPISWTPGAGAYSPRWGTLRVQRPLIEAELDMVTQAEADAYNQFRTTYEQYWRAFIDPIGVRIQRSADGAKLALDGRMLPIIDSSEYNELIELTGQRTFIPGASFGALQWTFALGEDAGLRRELSRMASGVGSSRQLTLDWIGDWIALGLADRGALWDILLYMGEVVADRDAMRDQARKKRVDELSLIARFPGYLMVQIKSPAVLASALAALKREVESSAPGMVLWGTGAPYRDIATVTIGENLLQSGRVGLPIQVHYATVKGVFVAALDRMVLEQCIDAILDGRGPSSVDPAKPTSAATQTEIALRPWENQSWLHRAAAGTLEIDARDSFMASLDYWEALARGLGRAPTDADALAQLGRALAKPHGQPISAGEGGQPNHPIYGSRTSPLWPKLPVASSPVTAAIDALRAVRMDLSFEGSGDDRGIHARVEIERADK